MDRPDSESSRLVGMTGAVGGGVTADSCTCTRWQERSVLASTLMQFGLKAKPLRGGRGGKGIKDGTSACSDLSESILQWTDGITGRVSRKADLLSLSERLGGNPVQVSVANPASKTKKTEQKRLMVVASAPLVVCS